MLRQRYWTPTGRQRVRSLLCKCVICKKVAGKPYATPDPLPLIKDWLNSSHLFEVTSVDYTGALYVRSNSIEQKVYICLFNWAVSRAIHLEIMCDLTLVCFLRAFRRFVGQRSLPRLMLSGNVSTYQAAAEELQSLFSSAALGEDLAKRGVKWHLIPKRTPWFGGFWEQLIGLTKSVLKKVLGRTHATLDSLQTMIVEVEATFNNCPTHLWFWWHWSNNTVPSVDLPHLNIQDDEISDATYGETDLRRGA